MRPDPFVGYSLLLRVIIYGAVPAFTAWQFVRLRRALHVFQLEGYKRARFLDWCKQNRDRARFLSRSTLKKPLVMTGRAWRILLVATLLTVALLLGPAAGGHLAWGAPADLIAWALSTVVAFWFAPQILVAADVLLAPVQKAINSSYERGARAKLARIGPEVVGVTGSFGKTSTKVAIAGLLGGTAYPTPGSYNTPMGVCRAINEGLDGSHRFFIVEMGAYQRGEIAELCRLVEPKVGVLTAIGPAHLERFGSLDTIRAAKYEIVQALAPSGVAVMNVDDPEVRALADKTDHVRVIRYGIDVAGRPDVTATEIRVSERGTQFIVGSAAGSAPAGMRLLGRHAIGHVLAAVGVGIALDRSLEELVKRIGELEPAEHRLQVIPGAQGVTVIDDAYNSNPDGAASALEVLDAMPGERKVVVTPGIIELGSKQAEANERFGEAAAEIADTVIVVARVNRDALVKGAERAGGAAEVITVDSLDQATEELKRLLRAGDVVLFENDLPDQYEN
ncbi:MAG TPA: UDP-N-acetylmuramoyl-tripeptide--D-alanyl-D-alanine ligase [Actinomycetota bacterium]|nr:UDP-N-acetylmuramoyl-tripeptide--D-alanyl-D-alanine ligase [Actinomycetota bacterium]